jgi:hypothetical protein
MSVQHTSKMARPCCSIITSPLPEHGLLHRRYKDILFWGIAKATVPNYFLRRYLMSARPRNGALLLNFCLDGPMS